MDIFAKSHPLSLTLANSLFSSVTSPITNFLNGGDDIWNKSFLKSSLRDPDPTVDLLGVYLEFAVFFLIILVSFRHLIAHPFAKIVLPTKDSSDAKAVSKFGDSACECVNYAVFTFIGMSVCLTSWDWVWPSGEWWSGYADGGEQRGERSVATS